MCIAYYVYSDQHMMLVLTAFTSTGASSRGGDNQLFAFSAGSCLASPVWFPYYEEPRLCDPQVGKVAEVQGVCSVGRPRACSQLCYVGVGLWWASLNIDRNLAV